MIVTGPQNAHEQLGDKVVLDCEVFGFPIPQITWYKMGEDGRNTSLPGTGNEGLTVRPTGARFSASMGRFVISLINVGDFGFDDPLDSLSSPMK